ncbi:MAG: tachylectin-related carbohydrate-binding protein [Pseudoxanthomonas sp.]
MTIQTAGRALIALAMTYALACSSVAVHAAQDEHTGTSQQPLVGGALVDAKTRESYGLLSLDNSCSASLLRNEWAITAAHCVDTPSSSDPSGFVTNADTSATLTAAWATPQQRQSLRIITFRPLDVAIIRLSQPFMVNGSLWGYNRAVFQGDRDNLALTVFGRGIAQFATANVRALRDGLYRVGQFTSSDPQSDSYTIASASSQWVLGGDSGGPSFTRVGSVDQLVGVHSAASPTCVQGKACGTWAGPGPAPAGYSVWDWVAMTSNQVDAPVAPAWADIDRYLGVLVPAPEPFVGRFNTTPVDYQPIWLYAIKPTGELMWYRKESGSAPWLGPKQVGVGWAGGIRTVIAAGGNAMYALMDDGTLRWYRHDGFNDGAFKWSGPTEVAHGMNYAKIFAGGEGVIYAIQDDGTLVWYRHTGYSSNGGADTMIGPKVVGSGWSGQRDVFSAGHGAIYVVRNDGTLSYYTHTGYLTGEPTWTPPRNIGTGWNSFIQIVSAGDGVVLGIQPDGQMLWYRYRGFTAPNRIARLQDTWEGRTAIGSGWQGYKQVFALLPAPPQAPR